MTKQLQVSDLEQIPTDDGSTTLYHRKHKVTYKSKDGALSESHWVFCRQLNRYEQPWKVLELGFGTGINFTTTVRQAVEQNRSLQYISIDHYPIPPELVGGEDVTSQLIRTCLQRCRETTQPTTLSHNQIQLTLYPSKWKDVVLQDLQACVVYHDPFDPKVNPQCWTAECFEWAHRHLSDTGILTTYSAAGHVRRAMAAAGFFVARSKGFGKKREMTVAAKDASLLQNLKIKYKPNRTDGWAFSRPD